MIQLQMMLFQLQPLGDVLGTSLFPRACGRKGMSMYRVKKVRKGKKKEKKRKRKKGRANKVMTEKV